MNSNRSQCSIESSIKELITRAGAVAVGIAEAMPVEQEAAEAYDLWLEQSKNAGMAYMERYRDIRRDPRMLLDGCKSIITAAFSYAQKDHSTLFSDYALGKDYHDVLRQVLAPATQFLENYSPGTSTRICIDSAPIRERYWAVKAGIGFIGLNNQLIIPGIGSKVFLAEILWTGQLQADNPCKLSCGECRRCLQACPGHALDGHSALDASKCLSYLTIEHRGELPPGVSFPGKIYGCDICQDVCPHNNNQDHAKTLPEFLPSEEILNLDRERIRNMDNDHFRMLFRKSPVWRIKLANLQRNTLLNK